MLLQRLHRLLSGDAAALPADAADAAALAEAVLLLEMAWADDDLAAPERRAVREALARRHGLAPADVDALLAAAENARRESHDHFAFTRLLCERLDRPARLAVLRELWRVVYADGVLAVAEDALIHKFARLLEIPHRDLIALKLSVRDD